MTSSVRRLLLALCLVLAPLGAAAQADCPAPDTAAATYPRRSGALSEREMAMARTAWRYFENNTQPTGLVNAVDNYPSTTMWDSASYLSALVAARELGIVSAQLADERTARLLASLNAMRFFRGELPNKVYHTQTLERVDYGNQPGEIGFSALDLGRLLVWLKITRERYPQHADAIDQFVLRWDFSHVVGRTGIMFGALVDKEGKTQYVQEGRLGYEEYAAKGFELWGHAPELALRPEPYATVPIYCVEVPYDTRDPRRYIQHNYVVTESYVLDGIEFNWDLAGDRSTDDQQHSNPWMAGFARRVYQAQENRFRATGILTARSEHQVDAEPWFVYDTVFTDGYAWNTISEDGKYLPELAAVSLKAALGMWVLWQSEYSDRLFEHIADRSDPQRGFHEGVLENGKGLIRAFTANNNGIMLATLLSKAQGKLLRWGPPRQGLWERDGAPRAAAARAAAAAGQSPCRPVPGAAPC